uniref:Uncharacterized protein n=1 Tax=Arundo donax TaxID=35708 RepID=A0A0A8Z955_ARUDO
MLCIVEGSFLKRF